MKFLYFALPVFLLACSGNAKQQTKPKKDVLHVQQNKYCKVLHRYKDKLSRGIITRGCFGPKHTCQFRLYMAVVGPAKTTRRNIKWTVEVARQLYLTYKHVLQYKKQPDLKLFSKKDLDNGKSLYILEIIPQAQTKTISHF